MSKNKDVNLEDIVSVHTLDKIHKELNFKIHNILNSMDLESVIKETFVKFMEQKEFQNAVVSAINSWFGIIEEEDDFADSFKLMDMEEEFKKLILIRIKEKLLSNKYDKKIDSIASDIISNTDIDVDEYEDIIFEKVSKEISKKKIKIVD